MINPAINTSRYFDYSGGQQTFSSRLLARDNELVRAVNARYNKVLGGVTRRPGYEIVGNPVEGEKIIRGLNSFAYKDGNKLISAANSPDDASTNLKFLNGSNWESITSIAIPSANLSIDNLLDRAFIVGHAQETNNYINTFTVGSNMSTSTTLDSYNAPRAKYLVEYNDKMYAINCEVGGVRYPNRVYASSTPMDAITTVNGSIKNDNVLQIKVDSARYLKVGMVVDIYGENSNVKKVDSLTIVSVDKAANTIGFVQRRIDISDRDEIYLEDQKGNLRLFWNIDYPNPDTADFLQIKPVKNETPVLTGGHFHNNRLFVFTEHSMHKWDGGNFVTVSKMIGTTSNDSIREVNGWLVFANKLGFWAYNDASGQPPQLISKPIQNYVDAINQANVYNIVASSFNGLYKAFVGTIGEVGDRTTSTSTSSTSTSTSSTSTSSTSTSSTSTSFSSTSTSSTTTSTSTSSISTSSTSSSTSSTTTTSTGISASVFVYDFNSNTWAIDTIDRNIHATAVHQMHGYEKPYFGDHTGRVFRDETGYTDNGNSIPFLIETKRKHHNLPEESKPHRGVYIYTQNGQGAVAYFSIDGGEFKYYGQLEKNITYIPLGDVPARDIALRIVQNDTGEPVVFIGETYLWMRGDMTHASN